MENLKNLNLNTLQGDFLNNLIETLSYEFTLDYFLNITFGIPNLNIIINAYEKYQKRRHCLSGINRHFICRTCYGDECCFCENCFNANEHEGHLIIERTNENAICCCQLFRFGGENKCDKHDSKIPQDKKLLEKAFGKDLEYAKNVVRIIFRSITTFLDLNNYSGDLYIFTNIAKESSIILQSEVMYQLFSEVSSEKLFGEKSFIQNLFELFDGKKMFAKKFINDIANSWFLPLAMNPINYQHYEHFIKQSYNKQIEATAKFLFSFPFQKNKNPFVNFNNFDRLLLSICETCPIYFNEYVVNNKEYNPTLHNGCQNIINIITIINENSDKITKENEEIIQTILIHLLSLITQNLSYSSYLYGSTLTNLKENIYKLLSSVSDEVLSHIGEISESKKVNKIITNFCFNSGRLIPTKNIICKKATNNITLPKVTFLPFENIKMIGKIECNYDITNLNKL